MSKVRIINSKTGEVKFVSSVVAKQIQQLATYGFKVQDLEKKEVDKVSYTDNIDSLLMEETRNESDVLILQTGTFDNLVDEQPTIERKKPGPKPKNQVTE